MPCFSRIETVLIDLSTIEKAAKETGVTVERISDNRLRLKKGDERVYLERSREGEKWFVEQYSGTDYFDTAIINPLSIAYAKSTIKTWAQKNNYQFSAGKSQGDYVLTQYVGK